MAAASTQSRAGRDEVSPWSQRIVQLLLSAVAGGALFTTSIGATRTMVVLGALLGVCIHGGMLGWSSLGEVRAHAAVGPRVLVFVERHGMWLTLLFCIPIVTMPVPPGADMSMHVAIARAIREGGYVLSPAWGDWNAHAYPRGFPGWIAVASTVFGYAKAGLIAASLSQVLVAFAIRAWLRDVVRARWPSVVAIVTMLASKVPQGIFCWGGNPSSLALALGLFSAALIARLKPRDHAATPIVTLWIVGAIFIHPIAGLVSCIVVAAAFVQRIERTENAKRVSMLVSLALDAGFIFGAAGAAMLWLKAGGPVVSVAEHARIYRGQHESEAIIHGARSLFPITMWPSLRVEFGTVYVVIVVVAIVVVLRGGPTARRAVARAFALLFALGALLAFGPDLPGVGFVMHPARLVPLALLIVLPLVARALETMESARFTPCTITAALIAGLAVHIDLFQTTKPVATSDDVALMACIDERTPKGALIDNHYADGAIWIPALTGHMVTDGHTHWTVQDEVDRALAGRRPMFAYHGARRRYAEGEVSIPPGSTEICRSGPAALYRLP